MRIMFLCPPTGKINGGIKYLFRMVEALCADGFAAFVVEPEKRRPQWFANTAPLLGYDEIAPQSGDILVLPEDQPAMLRNVAAWPQRKVIYCQNHFYAAIGAQGSNSFADFGVTDILCSSATIRDYCTERHPTCHRHLVPCGVDTQLFRPSPKQPIIAYIPRKRAVEAVYLQDLLRQRHPQWGHVQWHELTNVTEAEIALAFGTAAVFLSLSRLDGFGLTPIEAMASGCVVAGFTGIGGREYATAANGFWAAEDDFPACLAALDSALQLWQAGGDALAAYHAAATATAAHYRPEQFIAATRQAWTSILHG